MMKEETKKWIEKAKSDIDTAGYNLNGKRLDAAAFYSQQAAEKALKALQIEMTGNFSKVHDLLTLAESVKASEEIKKSCAKLTPFYTIIRYPDVEETITKKTAKELVSESLEKQSFSGSQRSYDSLQTKR